MQLEWGYGGIAFRMTDQNTMLRVMYQQYSTTFTRMYLVMQVAGRWTYLGQLWDGQRDAVPIYIPQRIADDRFNGRNNITYAEFLDDAKTQSDLAGHGSVYPEFLMRARVKGSNIRVWLLPLDSTHGMAKEDAKSDTHSVRNDIDRYYGYDGSFSPLWGP